MKVSIGKYRKNRKVEVRIDDWDTWSADHTLAIIIYPLLKKLAKKKQGAPRVDDDDVPSELRSVNAKPKKNEYDTDEFWFKRWDWVLGEMIWTFKQLSRSEEKNFWIVEPVFDWDNPVKKDRNTSTINKLVEGEYDEAAAAEYELRIKNGLRLFGKYYRGLWT